MNGKTGPEKLRRYYKRDNISPKFYPMTYSLLAITALVVITLLVVAFRAHMNLQDYLKSIAKFK